jgi:hypothetical protein
MFGISIADAIATAARSAAARRSGAARRSIGAAIAARRGSELQLHCIDFTIMDCRRIDMVVKLTHTPL